MKPSDISVGTEHLFSGFTAPEEILVRVACAWEEAAASEGLILKAYKRASGKIDGRTIVAWCVGVGVDEDMYLIEFDSKRDRVFAVYEKKAVRLSERGA